MLHARDPRLADEPRLLTVSQLAREARLIIEEHLGWVTVEGEISNFRKPGSGHWYFTLKDPDAQIRCAMFAGRNRAVRLTVRDGVQVRVSGRVSLYEPRGDFQLIVERMQPAGEGALKAAFEALKEKLAGEGLFDSDRKRPLPPLPRHLTIISSGSGAALRDVLHVIERRYPALEVLLIPSAVQGDGAEPQLLEALEAAGGRETDLVLLTRGGGSLEDLWAFNLESVARAVADCPHPVVSAIGHQTDFTITDFVADVRAPTPSAAAELITPDAEELVRTLSMAERRFSRSLNGALGNASHRLQALRARLVDPATHLAMKMQQTDELAARLLRAWQWDRGQERGRVVAAARALELLTPRRRLADLGQRVADHSERLGQAFNRHRVNLRAGLDARARALSAVSPLATMGRGYAVLTRDEGGTVDTITAARIGDSLTALLHDGSLALEVRGIDPEPPLRPPVPDEEQQDVS
jgi:exodeoxyribonuclease VII large subunit